MTGPRAGSAAPHFDLSALVAELWRYRYRIALVTILLCALTYAVLLFVPKQYESTASLLIEPRENAFSRTADNQLPSVSGIADTVIMSSQSELIQSPDTLSRVVRELDLVGNETFMQGPPSFLEQVRAALGGGGQPRTTNGSDASEVEEDPTADRAQGDSDVQRAVSRLQDRLTVVRQSSSSVLSIIVRTPDRDLSARLANAIARAHVARRAEQSVDDTAEATRWLETQIEDLRRSVADAEEAVAQYRIDNDLFVGADNTSLVDQQLSAITSQITAAQERKNTARTRAALIRELLNAGQPIDGVPDVRESPTIQQLAQRRAELQAERAQLSSNLLPGHPEIQALTAQVDEVQQQIATEGRQVADALEAEARIEENLEQSLRDELTELKLSASNATTSTVELQELEREATAQRNLLETYLLRYRDAASRIDSNAALPDVRIITLASPALGPAAPRVNLIILAIAIIAVAVQAGLVLVRALLQADTAYWHEGELRPAYGFENVRVSEATIPPSARRELPAMGENEPDRASGHEDGDRMPEPPATREDWAEAENEPVDAPADEPERPAAGVARAGSTGLAELGGALASGDEQTIIVLGLDREADCAHVAEQLIISALDHELSVALVDAGSGMVSTRSGITDLAVHRAEFGEVVTNSDVEGLSEVCWGTLPTLKRGTDRPTTLVEALQDIFEVVIVMVGVAGSGSNLKQFSGVAGRLVMVRGEDAEGVGIENVSRHAAEWGFDRQDILRAPGREVEVA